MKWQGCKSALPNVRPWFSVKRVDCPLWVGSDVLTSVKDFKYLGVLFISERRMEQEIDRRLSLVSAVMQTLYSSKEVKRELRLKARLPVDRSIFVPTLTYDHHLWVVTERMKFQVQAVEMSLFHRMTRLSLRDRGRSSSRRDSG